MNENLQYEIEEYVSGRIPPEAKKILEEKAISDENVRKEIADLAKVREALLRNKVRQTVNEARKATQNHSKRGLTFTLGTLAAAASIIFFMLSTPVMLSEKDFNYRGSENQSNTETLSREQEFEKARQLINEKQNPVLAIEILEKLQNNENVSRNYQNESKWMLVLAYLQTDQVQKAEKTFSEINCVDIDCPFSTWKKIKIEWQIFIGKVF